jgi:hypothetical protein
MNNNFNIINKSNPMNYKSIKVSTDHETLINNNLLTINNKINNIKEINNKIDSKINNNNSKINKFELTSTCKLCIMGILSINL